MVGLALAAVGLSARPRIRFRANVDAISGSASAVISMMIIAAGVIWIVFLMVTRAQGGVAKPPAAPWRRVVIAFTALVVVIVVVSHLHLHRALPAPAKPRGQTGPAHGGQGPVHHHGNDVYLWMAVVFVMTAVVTLVAIRRARRENETADEDSNDDETSPLGAAVSALAGDQHPRTRVIDAYAAMEQALARPVRARAPHDTPEEWLEKIAQERPWLRGSAAELTELFERARFSRLPITEADAEHATAVLTGMNADLRPEVGTP